MAERLRTQPAQERDGRVAHGRQVGSLAAGNETIVMIEIISKGRAVQVSEAELAELRAKCGACGWYRYCQLRLSLSHADALATFR